MKIDPHHSLPLYAQVESIIAAAIADGTFPPGSRLPNEDALIERYAVSRTTIRQTIQNLIRRGLVEIRRGKGTFVLQPKMTQELTELTGFVEDMQVLGRQASARLLDQQIVDQSKLPEVAHHDMLAGRERSTDRRRQDRLEVAGRADPAGTDLAWTDREVGTDPRAGGT